MRSGGSDAARGAVAAIVWTTVTLFAACSAELPMGSFVPATTTLAAEDYQTEIMEIDQLVFSAENIGEKGRTALAAQLENLAAHVDSAKGDSTFLGLEVRELKKLAAMVRRIPAGRPVPSRIQDYWMRIRSNVFDDRGWFARSAADLSAPHITSAKPRPAEIPAEPEPEEAPTAASPPVYRPGTGPATILEGRWATTAMFMNGKPFTDPEMSGSWWIFRGGELDIISPNGSSVGRYRFQVVIDQQGSALRVESQPGSERDERGWMLYELKGDELRLAFVDGLGERPDGFDSDSRREPELIVVVVTRT